MPFALASRMTLIPLIIVMSQFAAPDSARNPEGPGVWLAELPAGFTPHETVSIQVHGCRISAGYAVEAPPFPPINHVFVRKEGCDTGGYALVGTSYAIPTVVIDGKKQQGIAAAFSFRDSLSGSGFVKTGVVSVDFVTGEVTHSATLAAFVNFGTARVEPSAVDVKGNGTVVVRGTKNGVMGTQFGEGDHFIAVFDKFFQNPNPFPAASFIIAY